MTPREESSTTPSRRALPYRGWPRAGCARTTSATRSPSCCALMLLFVGVVYATTSIPSPNSIATRQSTLLLYSNGKTLAHLGDTNRTNVTLKQVPIDVQHAVLSAEDRNFESEPGISPTGIM